MAGLLVFRTFTEEMLHAQLARGKNGDTDMFDGPPASTETGSGECKVGERYVMLYALKKAYFVHVSKDDESWRDKIKTFEFKR